MSNYNIYTDNDNKKRTLQLDKVKLSARHGDRIFSSLMYQINNGNDPGKIQALVGLLGTCDGYAIIESTDDDGNPTVEINGNV